VLIVPAVFAPVNGLLDATGGSPNALQHVDLNHGRLGSPTPLRHIVIVLMENHAFDNFFGTYCPKTGKYCPATVKGLPSGICVPRNLSNPLLGCVTPFAFPSTSLGVPDLPHEYNSTMLSIHGGAMNGFVAAAGRSEPMGHFTGQSIPLYWDLAEEYGLGDDFFSSALTYSLPNHWDLVAGQVPKAADNASVLGTGSGRHAYLDQANTTKTVIDELNATPSVSWRYYDWSLDTYQQAIQYNPDSWDSDGSAYNYWNPLAAKYESYTHWYSSHFVARSTFFSDAASGSLPNVSWVMPDPAFSDHPPSSLANGESFVASVVDALESSPEWRTSALFLSWDDYGGFYDHVAPPKIDPLGLSIRVPLIVVSPYTPRGLVVHSLDYFESLLHFVEWQNHLGCLTPRDCHAPLPLAYFNFNLTARPGMLFPTNPGAAIYPMMGGVGPRPTVDALVGGCGNYCVNSTAWNTGPPPADEPEDDLD
jgi:phospholipase C